MPTEPQISANSRRIAKNTVLLYFRMLLLMFIGLFTSRVVLKALGIDDYGVYNAVGDVVMGFTFITASVSAAISRYMAHGLGAGDQARQKRVFSTAVIIQLIIAVLLAVLVETLGMWLLHNKMVIPVGRMDAAEWVLQCSLVVLVINLLAVPYNASIIAHEKMGAFAAISLVEGALKLTVALLLYLSAFDKLITYAVLMMVVALIVRSSYALYCKSHFEESRGKIEFDGSLLKEMSGFAGWNFFGSSAWVLNTKGVNIVVNMFFGVAMNAARGVAAQVENIVKQFVTNFLTAINPQITKSWAAGDKEYCFELVRKGAKYTLWVIILFFIPIAIWTEPLLQLWLGTVPPHSAVFVRLTLLCLLVDMTGNTLLTLVQATGDIKKYYLVTGLTSYLCLPLVWVVFKFGAGAEWAYICFILVYLVVFVLRLWIVRTQTGFPIGRFFRGLFTVTPGEKAFLLRKFGRFMGDRAFLKAKYRETFGRKLDLRDPKTYNEKIQWLKLHDHNPLYHALVDKAEVKAHVAGLIGDEYVIPTLGVWNSASEIEWDALPDQFVLKCTHDSGSIVICADKATFDRDAATATLEKALKRNFVRLAREWAYKGVKPRIIAEAYLGADSDDYKFFCFDGQPKVMFVATDRFTADTETKFDFFDMDGAHLDIRNGHPNAAAVPALPAGFDQMKALAAKLSAGIPHVRVDFYQIGGRIYFGEYTFYHWGGMVPFEPESADEWMGQMIILPRK